MGAAAAAAASQRFGRTAPINLRQLNRISPCTATSQMQALINPLIAIAPPMAGNPWYAPTPAKQSVVAALPNDARSVFEAAPDATSAA